MPTLAGHQTQYMPYPGMLDKLLSADVFVFSDCVQYVKREFQNRNRIRTPEGWKWVTIPVQHRHDSLIRETTPLSGKWKESHRSMIQSYYAHSPYLSRMEGFWDIAETHKEAPLSIIAQNTAQYLAELLDATRYKKVKIILESDLHLTPKETSTATSRIIALCKRLGCDRYLSGTGAHAYLETSPWEKEGIELAWQDFNPQPYTQQYSGWEPNLSTVDLVLNVADPSEYLRVARTSA